MSSPARVTVVIATRNRREELLRTLGRLTALPEQPPVIMVDNGSADGSAEAAARRFPRVEVVALARNVGAAAVLIAWLRRPAAVALAETRSLAAHAARDRDARAAPAGAARRLPRALAARRRPRRSRAADQDPGRGRAGPGGANQDRRGT